jgi:hypothetical protein
MCSDSMSDTILYLPAADYWCSNLISLLRLSCRSLAAGVLDVKMSAGIQSPLPEREFPRDGFGGISLPAEMDVEKILFPLNLRVWVWDSILHLRFRKKLFAAGL